GPIREAHVWVSRAWGRQSQDEAKKHGDIVWTAERPKEEATVPRGLDWELWLGPAPKRPFHGVYVPGPKWYRGWDFGGGTMSVLGGHGNGPAVRAPQAGGPEEEGGGWPGAARRDRPRQHVGELPVRATRRPAARQGHLVSGDGAARTAEGQEDPRVEQRRPLRRVKGDAPVRVLQARPVARKGLRGVQISAKDDCRVDRPSRRVAACLQDRLADDVSLRLQWTADRGGPPWPHRVPRRQASRMGRQNHAHSQRARGRGTARPRLSQGLETGVRS